MYIAFPLGQALLLELLCVLIHLVLISPVSHYFHFTDKEIEHREVESSAPVTQLIRGGGGSLQTLAACPHGLPC